MSVGPTGLKRVRETLGQKWWLLSRKRPMASGLEHPGKEKAMENSSSILGSCQYLREQNGSMSLRGFQMQSRLCSVKSLEVKRGRSALEIGWARRRESRPQPGFCGTAPGFSWVPDLGQVPMWS